MTDTPYDSPAGKTLERLVSGRLDSLEQSEKELHTVQADAANLRAENSTLKSERDLLKDEVDRSRPIVDKLAQWGVPTAAIVNDRDALPRFEENAADKLGKKEEMTAATATAHSNSPRKSRVVQALVVIAVIVVIALALWFTLTHLPRFSFDTPAVTIPPVVEAPSAPILEQPVVPALPTAPVAPALTTTSVAGMPDTVGNRLTEIQEMCPTMEDDLRETMANDFSFDYYKYYLPQSCGGYQSALLEPQAADNPKLTVDELATLNQLLAKRDAEGIY